MGGHKDAVTWATIGDALAWGDASIWPDLLAILSLPGDHRIGGVELLRQYQTLTPYALVRIHIPHGIEGVVATLGLDSHRRPAAPDWKGRATTCVVGATSCGRIEIFGHCLTEASDGA